MSREENVNIFRNTERLCKSVDKLKKSIEKSIANQKLVLEEDDNAAAELNMAVASKLNRYDKEAEVIISRKRSFEAASKYGDNKVCVHNFASASNPGGGVVRGSSAQEECLCRCSTLYFNLSTSEMWNGFYAPHRGAQNPLYNDDCIYTPEVIVFKTDTATPVLMPEEDWYFVNVITCAAPNLREKPRNLMNSGDGHKAVMISDKDLQDLHEKRLSRILDIALSENNEVVILGAFGCGAFKNKPEIVARATKNVIGKYMHAFKTIEFAIYCPPQDDTNFKTFENILKGRRKEK